MGTRELQKNLRRRAILDAARSLILDGRSKDFSMPTLAEAAGVSLVTPYNLFGSKSNILLEIVREDIFERAAHIEAMPCAALAQWIADLSAALARVYYGNRHFYRRMIVTLVGQERAAEIREVVALTFGMFEPAIARLQRDKRITADIAPRILAQQVARIVSGALQECLNERGFEARLKHEIELGILLLMAGLCSAADRTQLLARLKAVEAMLG